MKSIVDIESGIFSSLSHPKRVEILHVLCHGPSSVSNLIAMTGLSQANVSQHLSVLRDVGLVIVTKRAQTRIYDISSNHVAVLIDAVRTILLTEAGKKETLSLAILHSFTDPVCKMTLTALSAYSSKVYSSKRYYFCAQGCEERFIKQPNSFVTTDNGSQEYKK